MYIKTNTKCINAPKIAVFSSVLLKCKKERNNKFQPETLSGYI